MDDDASKSRWDQIQADLEDGLSELAPGRTAVVLLPRRDLCLWLTWRAGAGLELQLPDGGQGNGCLTAAERAELSRRSWLRAGRDSARVYSWDGPPAGRQPVVPRPGSLAAVLTRIGPATGFESAAFAGVRHRCEQAEAAASETVAVARDVLAAWPADVELDLPFDLGEDEQEAEDDDLWPAKQCWEYD